MNSLVAVLCTICRLDGKSPNTRFHGADRLPLSALGNVRHQGVHELINTMGESLGPAGYRHHRRLCREIKEDSAEEETLIRRPNAGSVGSARTVCGGMLL